MLPEIDKTELLSSSIAKLSAENDIIKAENNKIKAENDKIRAENTELKARIAKLEDMRFFLSRFEKIYVLSRDTVPLRGMSRSPWTRGEE